MTKDIKAFIKFLWQNILIIMAPVVLVGFIIVFVLLRSLLNDAEALNNSFVDQWNNLIRAELEQITLISHQIERSDDAISTYAKRLTSGYESDIFDSYDVVKALHQYMANNIICDEIAVYFKTNQSIISDNAAYSLKEYYQINFENTGISFENWKKLLEKKGREGFFISQNIEGSPDNMLLFYCRNIRINNNSNYMFLVRIKEDALLSRAKQISAKKDIAFALSDGEGDIIFKSADFKTPYNDKTVLKRSSSIKNVTCLYQFNDRNYAKPYGLIVFFIGLFAFAIIVSVFLGIKQTREFKNAIENIFDEIDHMENDLDEQLSLMKGKTLLNIMRNQPVNEKELSIIENEYTNLDNGLCYNVIVVEFESVNDINIPVNEFEIVIEKINEEIKEKVDSLNINCDVVRYNLQSYVYVLRYDYDCISQKLLKSLLKELFKRYKLIILAGIGEECTEFKNINFSYDTAKSAKYHVQNDVSQNVICWNDIKNFETDKIYYSVDREKSLIRAVNLGEISLVERIFDELYNVNFSERNLSHSMCRRLIARMTMTVYEILDKRYAFDFEKREKFERICRNLENNDNPKECFEIIKEICLALCDDSGKRSGKDMLVKKIEKYVAENYNDNNLNLASMADTLNINYHHLSRMFSESFGCNFATYLATVRLEKVKELLASTNESVEQIARLTGFANSGSLIRTFQKFYGTTPGKYRKDD